MASKNKYDVDGIDDDELSPDFEEFDANYFDSEAEIECEESGDEDLDYCLETQDSEFYTDSEGKELNF